MRVIAAVVGWIFAIVYCALVVYAFRSNRIVLSVILGAGATWSMAWGLGRFAEQLGGNTGEVPTSEPTPGTQVPVS